MTLVIAYKASDKQIVMGLPNQKIADVKKDDLAKTVGISEGDLELIQLSNDDLEALNVLDDSGRVHADLLRIENGSVVRNSAYDPNRAAELEAKASKRAARKQAKADVKMAAFSSMTKQDFMALTANERWETIFHFMKSHLDD